MSADRARQRRYAPPSFAHLRRLTDDTGLLEHALGRIPRRVEGYTTDDNARALWVVTEWLSLGDEALAPQDRTTLTGLAEIYMAFLLWTQYEDGWWHNNIAYDRSPEPEEMSANHDCQGRSIWAVADAWVRLDGPLRHTARTLFMNALQTMNEIDSLRGQAFAMAASAHVIEAGAKGLIDLPDSWREQLTTYMKRVERIMNEEFRSISDEGWRWFEPAMTYSNGTLPWAMLRTYRVTGQRETLNNGLESLSFLCEMMTAEEGWLRPIGNDGWGKPDSVSRWDQQPLEMFKLALALEEAALAVEHAGQLDSDDAEDLVLASLGSRSVTEWNSQTKAGSRGTSNRRPAFGSRSPFGQNAHLRAMRDMALGWFYGENDKQAAMIDPRDGSCCDGLMESGPNINCGAESTISYLMTEALCRKG
ncbi:hypothetical protein [Cohnella candidum]|uniref:Glycosyltransferase n=1 Tax=Cohnella candidum TaxID=2674991 RepID=A0A3G3K4G6_9BACL|nr:hypothetical protein [Cohnella candidum]AYQ75406.1 hypothetical protein EAV92_00600 [Cohnella candidum]